MQRNRIKLIICVIPFIFFSNAAHAHIAIAVNVEALEYLFGMNAYKNRDLNIMPKAILLDLKLPRISGPEVMRTIRLHERTKSLPVVILTSSEEEQDMINSYKLRANKFIRKPIDFDQFVEAVQPLGLA